jgi:hypothetical protein
MTAVTRTFSLQRFVLLARSHWRSQLRHYLSWLMVCTIIAVPILGLQLIEMVQGEMVLFNTSIQGALYFAGLLFFGPVFAAQHFGPMRRREHALQVLMLPASVAEKWGLAAVTVLLLFPLFYTVWFALLVGPVASLSFRWDTQVYQQLMAVAPKPNSAAPEAANYAIYWPLQNAADAWLGLFPFLCYVALTGLAVTGSLLFRRAPFLSTLVVGFLVLLGTVFVALFAPEDSDLSGVLFRWWTSTEADSLPAAVHALNAWLWVCIPSLLWVTAWRGLSERELT